ncbi:MAG: hypothetical protein KAH48_11695, partial [Chlorobi bacterium]|nr:hypothetical protein [Chlorobiota bacterium]
SYSGLISEDTEKNSNRLLEFYKNEKLRFTPTQLNEAAKNIDVIRQSVSEFKGVKKKILASGEYEKVVSANSKPESEIFAAINPTDSNNIIISPMKYDINNMMEGLMLPIYYSKDFGQTWSVSSFRSKPVDPTAFVAGGGDPMFAFDANGKAYFSWINLYITIVGSSVDSVFASMFWVSSEDGGKNWDRYPNDALASIKAKYNQNGALMGLDGMHDKQWMAVDKSNSAYRNNLYTALVRFDIEGVSQDATIIVKRKLSNKNEFEPEEVVVSKGNYELVQFSSIDTDNSGNVHVTFFGMNGTYKAFYHAVSKNGGSSFETETKISEYNFSGGQMLGGTEYESIPGVNFARLMPSPQFAIDKSNSSTAGNMYMVWTADGVDSKMNTDYDIYISKSTDGGSVWTTPKIVNGEAKGQQYYP